MNSDTRQTAAGTGSKDVLGIAMADARSLIADLTARPGRIFTERRIDAPEPRDENFRTSASYAGFCREVSALLGQASAGESGRVAR